MHYALLHRGWLAALFLGACPCNALALVTSSGDPAHIDERALQRALHSQLGTKSSFPFWRNIGVLNESTAVYIGRGHILTAAHVGPGRFYLADGSSYAHIPGSERRFRNKNGSFADLCVFQVAYRPGDSLARLPEVHLGPVCPAQGSFVLLIGAGSGNSGGGRAKLASSASFSWNDDFRLRWGLNRVAHHFSVPMKTYRFRTPGYSTKFTPGHFHCQATPGDSGGAAFVYNRRTQRWELGGIILAIDSKHGGAEFGNQTYIADLTILPGDIFTRQRGLIARR